MLPKIPKACRMGGMIRKYDSGYVSEVWFMVWFALASGMIRGYDSWVWFGAWFEAVQHACFHKFCLRHLRKHLYTPSYPLNSSQSPKKNCLKSSLELDQEQTLLQSTCRCHISSHDPSWTVAPLGIWRIPWPSRLNLSHTMSHRLMKRSRYVRVNYINKPQKESSTVNVDLGE